MGSNNLPAEVGHWDALGVVGEAGTEQIAVLEHTSAWGWARGPGMAGHAGWASVSGRMQPPGPPRRTFCSSSSTVSEVPIIA